MQDELFSLFETLSTELGDDKRSSERGKSSDLPLLVMDPRRLIELLQTCTFIAQGQQHACFLLMHVERTVTDCCNSVADSGFLRCKHKLCVVGHK